MALSFAHLKPGASGIASPEHKINLAKINAQNKIQVDKRNKGEDVRKKDAQVGVKGREGVEGIAGPAQGRDFNTEPSGAISATLSNTIKEGFEAKIRAVGKKEGNLSLINENFCYGCRRFVVDYPLTEYETGWCRSHNKPDGPDRDYEVTFKKIRAATRVRQCPLVKEYNK